MEGSVFSARSIRGALHALADARRLGEHPLAGCRFVHALARSRLHQRQTPNTVALGHALRAALSQAIQSLKPAGAFDPNDAAWRYYTILHEQYQRRRMPDVVMGMLVVEKSQYFSLQARALAELGHVLAGWEQDQRGATAPGPGPMPIFMAPAMTGKVFLGREAMLGRMAAHLLRGESVALHGLPGVGKSTFAAALAHRPEIQQRFPDGVLWAGLGYQGDALVWLGEWAAALGLPRAELAYLTTLEARANAVHTAISTRRMLLVIDDAWTSDAALALRAGGPNCAHLLTTRLASVAADFAGPNAFVLPELDEADGLAVLTHHAPALAQTPQVAAGLARAVGNLPLALTLMGRYAHKAAHGSQRRLQAALDVLHQAEARLALAQPTGPLDPDGNGASERSLQAAIGLSDAALDDSARRAFYALSVFPPKPNTFSEEAALVVTGEPPEALDALVDAGLLEVEDGRYTLHPVMRDYAATIKRNESVQSVQSRMLVFYVRLAETVGLDASIGAIENNNVEAALDLAASSLLGSTTPNNDESVAAETNSLVSLFSRATDIFFPMQEAQGLYGTAERHLKTALHLARQNGDSISLTPTLFHMGQLSIKAANVNEAREYFESSLQYARQTNNLRVAANAVRHLGDLAFETGEYEDADRWYGEGLAIADRQHDSDLRCSLHLQRGVMSERLGNYAQAEHSFREGFRLARTLKSDRRLCEALSQLGGLSAKRGQVLSGLFDIVRALRIARRIQHVEIVCALLVSLAIGAMSLKRLNLADRWSKEALSIARQLGYSRLLTLALTARGNFESMKSRFADAEALYQDALQRAQRNQNAFDLCFTHNCIGVHYFLKRDWSQAIEQLSLSIDISTRMRMPELNGYAKFYLAQSLYESGQHAQAVATARESLQTFQEIGYGLAHDVQRWLSSANAGSFKGMAGKITDEGWTDS